MTDRVILRFVDVDVTAAQFAGNPDPETQLAPTVELAPGERIVSISDRYRESGTMGSDLTIVARVWIERQADEIYNTP